MTHPGVFRRPIPLLSNQHMPSLVQSQDQLEIVNQRPSHRPNERRREGGREEGRERERERERKGEREESEKIGESVYNMCYIRVCTAHILPTNTLGGWAII